MQHARKSCEFRTESRVEFTFTDTGGERGAVVLKNGIVALE